MILDLFGTAIQCVDRDPRASGSQNESQMIYLYGPSIRTFLGRDAAFRCDQPRRTVYLNARVAGKTKSPLSVSCDVKQHRSFDTTTTRVFAAHPLPVILIICMIR